MEKFRNCPICFEVPEQEIYQCSAGHIICSLCISKINGSNCPQCRVSFGIPRIRCRVLEEILDTQIFHCKFSKYGCEHKCKREEITSHFNSCPLNPDLVPLCAQMGLGHECHFHLGGGHSRAETIAHFESSHGFPLQRRQNLTLQLPGERFLNLMSVNRKRKLSDVKDLQSTCFWYFLTQDHCETSPLFLLFARMNHARECLSFVCIQVWGPKAEKYNAEFTLCKTLLSLSNEPGSSSAAINAANCLHLFPMSYTMKVCTIKDAYLFIRDSPINISLPFLQDSQFGTKKYKESKDGDRLQFKVSRVV